MTSLGMNVLMCNVSQQSVQMILYITSALGSFLIFFPSMAAFIELVHSSNGTTQRGADYGVVQVDKPKRMKSSRKGEKKSVSVVPSHFVQTDISAIKGETLIFSSMMFCILGLFY